jgi:hypothetical protein
VAGLARDSARVPLRPWDSRDERHRGLPDHHRLLFEQPRGPEVVDDHRAGVGVRDAKVGGGQAVVFSVAGWASFIAALEE